MQVQLPAFGGEEGFQQSLGCGGVDPVIDFGLVMRLWVREHAGAVGGAARFGITGTVIQARNTGSGDGPGAHGTGFQRDIQIAPDQTFGAQRVTGGADGKDFGVAGGIIAFTGAVAFAGQKRPIRPDNDRAHGDFAPVSSGACGVQRPVHMGFHVHLGVWPASARLGKGGMNG
jgi:hypothetical protein